MHAIAEGDRLIVRGPDGVPGERHDGAIMILAHGLLHQRRPGQGGVLVGATLKAEVLAIDGRVLAREVVCAVGPVGDRIRIVVLAGEDVMSGDRIQICE